jgi:hypothetical protein
MKKREECFNFCDLIALILIVLQFRREDMPFLGRRDSGNSCDPELSVRPTVDNSILFIIVLFYLCCCCKR